MAIKVAKFGGSSLADATQFQKVKAIMEADPQRLFLVPSAPGKRTSKDEKITDMLYQCYKMIKSNEDITELYQKICDRYMGIINNFFCRIYTHWTC